LEGRVKKITEKLTRGGGGKKKKRKGRGGFDSDRYDDEIIQKK